MRLKYVNDTMSWIPLLLLRTKWTKWGWEIHLMFCVCVLPYLISICFLNCFLSFPLAHALQISLSQISEAISHKELNIKNEKTMACCRIPFSPQMIVFDSYPKFVQQWNPTQSDISSMPMMDFILALKHIYLT